MTDNNHPITPPPELIEDWIELSKPSPTRQVNPNELATIAARWGADQELEACCDWFRAGSYGLEDHVSDKLRAARRSKPPSLKEQALNDLDLIQTHDSSGFQDIDLSTIRRALESLPD